MPEHSTPKPPCCSISRPTETTGLAPQTPAGTNEGSTDGMVYLSGGTFLMGSD